jgi:prolyl-tRNA synthetase
MMPDGRALQMGTSHNLGENFGKVFDVKYIGEDKMDHYVWQTSWGISTRLIGAMVMVHGDDKGLVIPPQIAPIQVVLVPIYFKQEQSDAITAKARTFAETLRKEGIEVHADFRDQYTPGWKFNDWEMKGVPLRVEVGPRDVQNQQSVLVRRDNSQKVTVRDSDLVNEVKKCLSDIQRNLFAKAKNALEEAITTVTTYDEFKKTLESRGGFIRSCWCGSTECEETIQNDTGATIRTLPLKDEELFSKCIRCGKPATKVAYFARSY